MCHTDGSCPRVYYALVRKTLQTTIPIISILISSAKVWVTIRVHINQEIFLIILMFSKTYTLHTLPSQAIREKQKSSEYNLMVVHVQLLVQHVQGVQPPWSKDQFFTHEKCTLLELPSNKNTLSPHTKQLSQLLPLPSSYMEKFQKYHESLPWWFRMRYNFTTAFLQWSSNEVKLKSKFRSAAQNCHIFGLGMSVTGTPVSTTYFLTEKSMNPSWLKCQSLTSRPMFWF